MKVKFTERPMPLYPELRPLFRISQIVMVLSICSRQKKSSLVRLHLFNWALNHSENRLRFLQYSNSTINSLDVWSMDPLLNQAIEFAVGEGIVIRESNKYILSPKGDELFNQIIKDEIFKSDLDYLNLIGKKITEAVVNSIVENWR